MNGCMMSLDEESQNDGEYVHAVQHALNHNMTQTVEPVMDMDDNFNFYEEFDCTPLINLAICPTPDTKIIHPGWTPASQESINANPGGAACRTRLTQ
jgi:hypothetical protein